ncbi:MAG: tetratricopeptide repeat protein [Nannocystaceae bacterium]|nr:tetratricopeptide repeat protein [Nannocystaceae bacterium]
MISPGHHDDGVFVHQPALAALVERARAQRPGPSRLDAATLAAAVAARRAARTRTIAIAALAVAASIAVLWLGLDRRRSVETRGDHEQAAHALQPGEGGGAVLHAPAPERAHVRDDAEVPGDATPHELVPQPSPQPLAPEQSTPERGTPPATTVPKPAAPQPQTREPSAAELSRQAEAAMADRRKRDAIALLETLVRRFPDHAAARTALLDLGRLLRDTGKPDRARCAYQRFVARWPDDPMRSEIDRALAALGSGPECSGLRPRR